jgi:hypothetical protein
MVAPAWRSRVIRVGLAVGLGYLLLASTFSILTPAWENNDEPDHVHYVEHLLVHKTPPRIALSNGIESHQPPLYYYLVAGWQRVLGIPAFTPHPQQPSGPFVSPLKRVWELSHTYTSSQHREANYDHALRLVSIALGLITVLAAVASGWLLTERVAFAAAVGATVALWPKFVVVTSAVTNSALVIAMCACAVPAFLMWRRTEQLRWAALTGAFLGAAALTEETALPVAGLMLLLLVGYAARRRDWRSPLVAVICFAVICGWWFIHDAVVYGDPLASTAARDYLMNVPGLVRNPPTLSLSILKSSLTVLAHSTWYDAGANQLQLPHALDLIVWVVAAASLVGAFWAKMRDRLLLATCALASVIAWLVIVRATTQAEGRYLLVGVIAWAAFLAAGGVRTARNREVALLLWPVIFAGLDIYVLARWLVPFGHVWG